MKDFLRKIFSPVLNRFEKGEGEYVYKESNRTILVIVGSMFLMLSLASLGMAFFTLNAGAGLPFLVFFCVGAVCHIVGFLGTDRAVARIWKNR